MDKKEEFTQLKAALDDSSDKNRNFLIAFILFELYLLAVILGISDLELFLAKQQYILPFFKVSVPFVSYFIFAPLLLVAFYFSVLFNLKEHSRLLNIWKANTLSTSTSEIVTRAFIFNLASRDSNDKWVVNTVLALVLVIIPVLVVSLIFYEFSKYQDWLVSLLHIFLLLFVMFLQFNFWLKIKEPELQLSHYERVTTRLSWFKNKSCRNLLYFAFTVGYFLLIAYCALRFLFLVTLLNGSNLDWEFGNDYIVPRIVLSNVYFNGSKSGISAVDTKQKQSDGCDGNNTYIDLKDRHLLSLSLTDVVFCNIDLFNSKLAYSKWQSVVFEGRLDVASMPYSNLEHVYISKDSSFAGTDLSNSTLSFMRANWVDFTAASFVGAKIYESYFKESDFFKGNFTKAEIKQSYLIKTKMQSVNFHNLRLIDSELKVASLIGATNLDNFEVIRSRLESIVIDNNNAKNVDDLFNDDVMAFDTSNVKADVEKVDKLIELAEFIGDKRVDLSGLNLEYAPGRADMLDLSNIDISNNLLDGLGAASLIEKHHELISLNLSGNQILYLPSNLKKLTKLKKLNLSDNSITTDEHTKLHLNDIEELDISDNNISHLAVDSRTSHLRNIDQPPSEKVKINDFLESKTGVSVQTEALKKTVEEWVSYINGLTDEERVVHIQYFLKKHFQLQNVIIELEQPEMIWDDVNLNYDFNKSENKQKYFFDRTWHSPIACKYTGDTNCNARGREKYDSRKKDAWVPLEYFP